ncbi:MAG: hypothetical protein GXO47_04800 [Chlorobi bacterium]|nr:hypothetical protein [Chlorobiota bacterium]
MIKSVFFSVILLTGLFLQSCEDTGKAYMVSNTANIDLKDKEVVLSRNEEIIIETKSGETT